MTLTKHGHHIPGSPEDEGDLPPKARCGGPGLCAKCSKEAGQWKEISDRDAFHAVLDAATQKHQAILTPRPYTSKPVTVEAVRFTGGASIGMDIEKWIKNNQGNATWVNAVDPYFGQGDEPSHDGWPDELRIETITGTWVTAHPGDWIIRGTENDFYPIPDEVFRKKYESTP